MKESQASPYRWVVLLSIVPIIISTEMMWLSLAPISSHAESYYGVTGYLITLYTMSYMIMFVLFCIPASWVIDRYGYRCSLIIGSVLTAGFGVFRAFFADEFTVVLVSQFFIAAGQPFLLNISTKVPANWFPISERATAAGILTMAQYVGFALPMVIAPAMATEKGIPAVLTVFAAIAALSAAVSILLTRERPAVPPPGPVWEKEDFSLPTLRRLLKNQPYLLALMLCFLSMGVFNTLLTLLESILLPRGISSVEAGTIGAVFVAAGVLGAVLLPIISDKLRIRIPFLIISLAALVPLYLGITFLTSFSVLLLIAAAAGFSIMGVAPILFQHGSETAYPVQEGTSLGMILLMGQISGVLFVFLFEVLQSSAGSMVPPMLTLVAITAAEIPLALKMKESPFLERRLPVGRNVSDK
ncbi:major facilitator superfamily domain-containing protein 7 [Anoxybacterium hadale]|uniref:Major facilitator superfamily domain-containing protein 7 n=1 Tax=Anoxybacterium hadale TaxID=3408580 RepID=A0ACD1ACT9_9FIRM|nr:major facilitator superfamily domain-containing protein 7 [Clostridiales bacterium]